MSPEERQKIMNNSQNDKEIPKKRYIFLKEKQKIIDNLKRIVIV